MIALSGGSARCMAVMSASRRVMAVSITAGSAVMRAMSESSPQKVARQSGVYYSCVSAHGTMTGDIEGAGALRVGEPQGKQIEGMYVAVDIPCESLARCRAA